MLDRRQPTPAYADGEKGNEEGSVVMALMIMMIIGLLGVAALAQSQQSLRNTERLNQGATASAGAERGLAEAMARLEHGEAPPFKGEGELLEGAFYYVVEQTDTTTVEIYAEAKVEGARRGLEAKLEGTIRAGYSIFATDSIASDRNGGTITGWIGSNGVIKINGSAPGDKQEIFSPNGECSDCPNLIKSEGPRPTPEPKSPIGPTQECPRPDKKNPDAYFSDVIDGKEGTPFVCDAADSAVIFKGEAKIINPPLVIYVGAGVDVLIYDSSINWDQPAADFQLFIQTDPKRPRYLLGQNSKISAALYAPGRDLYPQDLYLTGSLTLRSLETNSEHSISVWPDDDATSQGVGGWEITSWEMVPAR